MSYSYLPLHKIAQYLNSRRYSTCLNLNQCLFSHICPQRSDGNVWTETGYVWTHGFRRLSPSSLGRKSKWQADMVEKPVHLMANQSREKLALFNLSPHCPLILPATCWTQHYKLTPMSVGKLGAEELHLQLRGQSVKPNKSQVKSNRWWPQNWPPASACIYIYNIWKLKPDIKIKIKKKVLEDHYT